VCAQFSRIHLSGLAALLIHPKGPIAKTMLTMTKIPISKSMIAVMSVNDGGKWLSAWTNPA
jgi:hypothetical protein